MAGQASILGDLVPDDKYEWCLDLGYTITTANVAYQAERKADGPEVIAEFQQHVARLTELSQNMITRYISEIIRFEPRAANFSLLDYLRKIAKEAADKYSPSAAAFVMIGAAFSHVQHTGRLAIDDATKSAQLRVAGMEFLGVARRYCNQDRHLDVTACQALIRSECRAKVDLAYFSGSTMLSALQAGTQPESILLILPDPQDASPLGLLHEMAAIQNSLQLGQHSRHYKLHVHPAAQFPQLPLQLSQSKATIVHFAGHGEGGVLMWQKQDGKVKGYSASVLGKVLASTKRVKLVILNACHSNDGVHEMAKHVPNVVSMRGEIGDDAATIFSRHFYELLANGEAVKTAFDTAKLMAEIEGPCDTFDAHLLQQD
ncbi:hypothetical protein EMMF5_006202 [Cystobasidiomycetes sp. EMM_F5]